MWIKNINEGARTLFFQDMRERLDEGYELRLVNPASNGGERGSDPSCREPILPVTISDLGGPLTSCGEASSR